MRGITAAKMAERTAAVKIHTIKTVPMKKRGRKDFEVCRLLSEDFFGGLVSQSSVGILNCAQCVGVVYKFLQQFKLLLFR